MSLLRRLEKLERGAELDCAPRDPYDAAIVRLLCFLEDGELAELARMASQARRVPAYAGMTEDQERIAGMLDALASGIVRHGWALTPGLVNEMRGRGTVQ